MTKSREEESTSRPNNTFLGHCTTIAIILLFPHPSEKNQDDPLDSKTLLILYQGNQNKNKSLLSIPSPPRESLPNNLHPPLQEAWISPSVSCSHDFPL
jgi:hypothetical protein